ncbi:Pentatricopeptide repeat superfamily protein [Prunus dulcis]|uniref:Pentatricopeptide repeat superfamily protein n=1 Tax=Prunus dulcis TaxID=3755 RepID=A0A4Y1QLS3_PRUDU|nr:Pentatricopeptide repeat superfamily protein [Prunus dulcis]
MDMCGKLGFARKVFDEICQRDLVSWNSMISGYSKMGYAGDAVRLFQEMRDAEFEPDEMSLVSILGACGTWCGDLSSARRVFDSMKKKDRVTWNAMITGQKAVWYLKTKCGSIGILCKEEIENRTFQRLTPRYLTPRARYAQNGMSDEAMVLFDDMKERGVNPDKITLVGMLSACASIGALDLGRWIDIYASERGIQQDIYVGTALIDMYAKCGSLANALRVFEDMPQKNEVSWNAMISALAFHGRAHEAISLFKSMTEGAGATRPNDITFVGVLSACVHVGLVDEGRQLFNLMSSSFGLVPKVEHYSCLVDLLSRAGLVHEAWDFIKKMPEKPDEVVLGALLGACKKCKNVDVTKQVVQLLLELEPSNSGNYVISSKIYANLKMWMSQQR